MATAAPLTLQARLEKMQSAEIHAADDVMAETVDAVDSMAPQYDWLRSVILGEYAPPPDPPAPTVARDGHEQEDERRNRSLGTMTDADATEVATAMSRHTSKLRSLRAGLAKKLKNPTHPLTASQREFLDRETQVLRDAEAAVEQFVKMYTPRVERQKEMAKAVDALRENHSVLSTTVMEEFARLNTVRADRCLGHYTTVHTPAAIAIRDAAGSLPYYKGPAGGGGGSGGGLKRNRTVVLNFIEHFIPQRNKLQRVSSAKRKPGPRGTARAKPPAGDQGTAAARAGASRAVAGGKKAGGAK